MQDLYIQAMAAIQALNTTNPESFFQQAAIHGACTWWWVGGGWVDRHLSGPSKAASRLLPAVF